MAREFGPGGGKASSPGAASPEAPEEQAGTPEPKATPTTIPSSGTGVFTRAKGQGSGKGGGEQLLRYQVEVENGIGITPGDAASEVDDILGHERGWTAEGKWKFRRTPGDEFDFIVRVATPETADSICGEYGLDTGGEVNCRVGKSVVVNLKRWLLATETYKDDIPAYRALIINHEVGHFLGYGHVGCPGKGKPAPAMMQQIKGLEGCAPNVWPFDVRGRPITGPERP
ncbi:DUF3152 domain-containing protein [Streptomyces olivoreticuli]|uniref:DUF3152 domain-containing protein n=1 Tax=Streptomyces olivoreticuli TaxID=68246 RepID=UPI0030B867EC